MSAPLNCSFQIGRVVPTTPTKCLAIFSRSSNTKRCATFFPMPGIFSRVVELPSEIALAISNGANDAKAASATRGPMPETV